MRLIEPIRTRLSTFSSTQKFLEHCEIFSCIIHLPIPRTQKEKAYIAKEYWRVGKRDKSG